MVSWGINTTLQNIGQAFVKGSRRPPGPPGDGNEAASVDLETPGNTECWSVPSPGSHLPNSLGQCCFLCLLKGTWGLDSVPF